jgi:hypothetical protein
MGSFRDSRGRAAAWIGLSVAIILLAGSVVQAQPVGPIRAFTYSKLLATSDTLTDGELGHEIPIDGVSVLIWVDLQYGDRFTHPSSYVLISDTGVRVLDGSWWPVINGESAFGTPPLFSETNELIRYPIDVWTPDIPEAAFLYQVLASPFSLRTGDRIDDGPNGTVKVMTGGTMFVWVDLMPDADFAHPTRYIFVGPEGVEVFEGMWPPDLNGRMILYGEQNDWGVVSPFAP